MTGEPFGCAEEAWIWAAQATAAALAGARCRAGVGAVGRLCEPGDILRAVDRLHRQRKLVRGHLVVLVRYGEQGMAPDPERPRQAEAHRLWQEAMTALKPALERMGVMATATG